MFLLSDPRSNLSKSLSSPVAPSRHPSHSLQFRTPAHGPADSLSSKNHLDSLFLMICCIQPPSLHRFHSYSLHYDRALLVINFTVVEVQPIHFSLRMELMGFSCKILIQFDCPYSYTPPTKTLFFRQSPSVFIVNLTQSLCWIQLWYIYL